MATNQIRDSFEAKQIPIIRRIGLQIRLWKENIQTLFATAGFAKENGQAEIPSVYLGEFGQTQTFPGLSIPEKAEKHRHIKGRRIARKRPRMP